MIVDLQGMLLYTYWQLIGQLGICSWFVAISMKKTQEMLIFFFLAFIPQQSEYSFKN